LIDTFVLEYLSKGSEGQVYLAQLKQPRYLYDKVVVKKINLSRIRNKKNITKLVLNATPYKLYRLFLSEASFNKPSLTEILSQTLTNQLVFQKICPHYALNLYWDLVKSEETILYTVNEYANYQDFHTWAKHSHSYGEWLNALFQIMVGLSALKRYFGMLHTDFHTGNILLQRIPAGGYWVYTIDNFKYYLPNLGFVVLIHDFGFAWIPDKLTPVKYHFNQNLKYITKNGLNFYDLHCWFEWLFAANYNYRVPIRFKQLVKNMFAPDEIDRVVTKRYYRNNPDEYQERLKEYPNIKADFTGLNTTLADKIYQIFYQNEATSYRHKPDNDTKIESYSLDKSLDKDKLPRNFRSLVL
jgi:hypothetical protein